MVNQRSSIFTKYAKCLLPKDNKAITDPILKDHAQISLLIDTLFRQKCHHLLLIKSSSTYFNKTMLDILAHHLSTIPLVQNAHIVYFDTMAWSLNIDDKEDIKHDFRVLCEDLKKSNRRIFFAIDQLQLLFSEHSLGRQLRTTLMDDNWRLIILTDPLIYQENKKNIFLKELFTTIKINEPTEIESLAILKQRRVHTEYLHQVVISEEVLSAAMSLANTYFSNQPVLDTAFELLDIAASRINLFPPSDSGGQKPVITTLYLTQIVSRWTHIPLTHLNNNTFQEGHLLKALQHIIFGHDRAIQSITTLLENACIKLHKKTGPLCSFMLAGSAHVGKASLVHAFAEQFFGSHDSVMRIHINKQTLCLADIMVYMGSHGEHCLDLYSAIEQMPYTIVFFENVEELSDKMHSILKNILLYGHTQEDNKKYDFRHAIIMISTTVGSERIIRQIQSLPDQYKQMDLMQLVLNEHIPEFSQSLHKKEISYDEAKDQLFPDLVTHFSSDLLQHVNVIPFLPLNYAAIEKIIRHKIHALKKRLDVTLGIELQDTPEVIQFLIYEVLRQPPHGKSVDTLLEYHVYSSVSHEIVKHMGDKNNTLKKLLLQLNDNGQVLRCGFVMSNEPAEYF